ncbi:hypothetical protein HID58_070637, partial [Brassica napus]
RPGQEKFPGDRNDWEKPIRGLLEGLKGKASVTGRRMKNFGVRETSGTSFVRYGPVHGGYIARIGIAKISSCCNMKWVVMCSPTCMVAYTPWRFYDPVDTTNEPSSCLLPRGMRREVSHKVCHLLLSMCCSIPNEEMRVCYRDRKRCVPKALIFAAVLAVVGVLFIIFLEEENMRRTYKEERNLE